MRLNTSSVLCTLLCLGPIIHTACGRPAPPSGSSKLTQSSGSGTSATPQTLTVSIDFPPPNDAKHPESASVPHEAVEVNKDLPYNYAVSGLEYYETSAHLRSYFGPKYAQHKIDYVMGKTLDGKDHVVPERTTQLWNGQLDLRYRIMFSISSGDTSDTNPKFEQFRGEAELHIWVDPENLEEPLDRSTGSIRIRAHEYEKNTDKKPSIADVLDQVFIGPVRECWIISRLIELIPEIEHHSNFDPFFLLLTNIGISRY
ncbi:hypothetical protein FB446DRAFT_727835 [Lentinula raphanica]|nr:hypothetical protein FB446DRAFT_727835 [Lentinula raphanica]